MKRFAFLLIILALALVFGLALASCGGGDGDSTTPGGNSSPGDNTPSGSNPGGILGPGGSTPGGETPGNDMPGGNTPGGTQSSLTITDIPAQFNGKYISFIGVLDNYEGSFHIRGCDSYSHIINLTTGLGTLSYSCTQINNGRAVLPMWMVGTTTFTSEIYEDIWVKFTGNGTFRAVGSEAEIFSSRNQQFITGNDEYATAIAEATLAYIIFTKAITFTNGKATVSWNDGVDSTAP